MPGSASPWAHLACPPNATRQAPPMAAATQERRLLAVACTRLFGAAQHARQFRQGFAVIGCLGMPATDQDGAQTHCLGAGNVGPYAVPPHPDLRYPPSAVRTLRN